MAVLSKEQARTTPLGWLATAVPLALTVLFAVQIPTVADGGIIRVSYPWVPHLDVALSFQIDGLSLIFALLISGIGTFIFLYSGAYLAGHPQLGRFYLYLTLFLLSMLGLVLADNVVALFVFWELTSITSYLLIGFEHTDRTARRNALQALLVTGGGGLALLAGFLMLASVGGSHELSALAPLGGEIRSHALYLPILVLVLIGAFTKSAQFPFHFWLPNAMAAPTPVSAFLHSATMVKGGVYLLARIHPVLGGTETWLWTLTVFGSITAVYASIAALRQTDLKLMLAYTTVMALGTLTLFLGTGSTAAIAAAVTFIIIHAFYKAALFMVVGIVDHEAGTRLVDRLGGLGRAMPVTAAAAALAALSMAGIPPFFGFIGKELMYAAAIESEASSLFVATGTLAANAMMVTVGAIIAIKPFHGARPDLPKRPHEGPARMWLGPAVLAVLSLVFGIAPGLIDAALVEPGVRSITAGADVIHLELWHGINLPLLLSVGTIAIGIGLFVLYTPVRRRLIAIDERLPITGDRAYDRTLDGIVRSAIWVTRRLQSGTLRNYLFIVMATLTIAVGGTLIVKGGLVLPTTWPDAPLYAWFIVLMIAAATLVVVLTHSRLAAICALGVIGTSIALIFIVFGAPDVAMTQLMVEILVVVIVALVLPKLPSFRGTAHPGTIRDALLGIASGATATALLLAVTAAPLDRSLTAFFEAESLPGGHGRNIVNVILVDFRALDTLGEITVVAIAGIACFALIRLRLRDRMRSR